MVQRLLVVVLMNVGMARVMAQDATVPFTTSNLPIVILNTGGQPILDDPKIKADMAIIDNGPGMTNNVTDPPNNYDGKIGIEIRGSSSQMFPKKQYGIELMDEDENELEASLLGLPVEEDWILFAPYNDKTLMRDVLAYKLGRDLNRYAPRTRYCEVVLNGKYQGVYVLIEKIKRDKNRVDINKLDPEEITGNSLTGGYIIKIDKTTGDSGEGWYSPHQPSFRQRQQKVLFQYEIPKYDEIVPEQKAYIEKYVTDFEDVLKGDNFKDPVNGYAKFIDVNSFVDFLLVQEMSKNVDGYRLSTFFHKKRDSDGGKIHMGPLWDFNLAFGNADYCNGGPAVGFAYNFNKVCGQDDFLMPFWYDRLLEDPDFKTKVVERWTSLRSTVWSESSIHTYIDSVATVLTVGAQQRNFTAWNVLNKYVWPNYYVGATYSAEVTWMKNWISQRLVWLDSYILQLVTDAETVALPEEGVAVYPNPFSGQVSFDYTIRKSGQVQVKVVDNMGRIVKTVMLEHRSPGRYVYAWEPEGARGFYYYLVKQGEEELGKGKIVGMHE